MLKRIFTLSGLAALALILIFIFASLASASSPPLAPSTAGELYTPDRILVRFEPGVDRATIADLHRKHGAVVIHEIPQIGVQVLRVPTNRVPEMVAAYSRNPNVLYAEPDYIAYAVGDPDDLDFFKQWGLDNDGQEYKEGLSGTVDADIDAPEAWDITTGSSYILIAILDTGIDQGHPDLDDKLAGNKNCTDSSTWDDLYGHGTHVAGIAAAETNNAQGVAGVGYNSSLLNVKVLNDQGSGYYSWIASGITWAADNGAQAINMSLGGYRRSRTLENAVNYAWNKGVVLAAAAGNDGTSRKLYPAAYTNCIAVAATDANDQRVDEPGWWASNYGDWVDVAAPGLYIYSTFPNHDYAIGKALNYDYGSGTSMSTPHVAGLAGLLFGQDPFRTNADVRTLIESTADPITGTGDYWIHGRINACKAVGGTECDAPVDNPPSVSLVDPIEGQTVSGTYQVLVSASDDSAVSKVELSIDGEAYIDITANFDGTYYFYDWDTKLEAEGSHTLQARATDDAAQSSDSALVNITVDNVNDPPVATFTYSCSGLSCDFDASGSYDPDGTITTYSWDFGDGKTGSGEMTTRAYASEGTYSVVLTVTDDDSATDTHSQSITVSEAAATMHVAAIDMEYKRAGPNRFIYTKVTIVDSEGSPVTGATVYLEMTLPDDSVVSDSGDTGDDGTVTFTLKSRLLGTYTSTVTDVVKSGWTYDNSANGDFDGDGVGGDISNSITVP